MPDDTPSGAQILSIDTHSVERRADQGSAANPENPCNDDESCFVSKWRKPDSAGAPENCKKCSGMFSSNTLLLSGIKPGIKDKTGQTIVQVYLSGEDYNIYRTRLGVNVHFADCRAQEREQRARYAEISQTLCRLRFLTGQMAHWPFARNRRGQHGGFYDHQIAEAICLTLQGRGGDAKQILDTGLALAEERVTNENRVRYLFACLYVSLIPVFITWPLYCFGQLTQPYLMAAAAGAVGAVFSIALRVQDLELKPCAQSMMNYFMGALRVLTGFLAGAVVLLIINGTIFGEEFLKVLVEPTKELTAQTWKCIVLVGFLGGFAERLVPSLLQNLQSKVENRVKDEQNRVAAGKELAR